MLVGSVYSAWRGNGYLVGSMLLMSRLAYFF